MGKGKARRRRAQNLLEAHESNLYKAQFGKALPSAKLPEPPSQKEVAKPYMPSSLRRMMELKEAMKKQEQQRSKRDAAQHGDTHATRAAADIDRRQNGDARDHSQLQGDTNSTARTTATDADTQAAPLTSTTAVTKGAEKQKPHSAAVSKQGTNEDTAAGSKSKSTTKQQKPVLGTAFELHAPSKTKLKKKAFLKQKKLDAKLKKKGQQGGRRDDGDEMQRENIKFGETVDAPLHVNLKRKHWKGDGDESSAARKRCTAVFMKQMQHAQLQLQRRAANDSQLKESERAALREQVMAAYRQQRKHKSPSTAAGAAGEDNDGAAQPARATRQSLAALVRRDAAAALAAARIA